MLPDRAAEDGVRRVRADGPLHVHQTIGSDYVRYDDSAAAILIVIHYFAGAPFKRLESLHAGWGVPFSDANQLRVVSEADDRLLPLYRALEQHTIQKTRTTTAIPSIPFRKLIGSHLSRSGCARAAPRGWPGRG